MKRMITIATSAAIALAACENPGGPEALRLSPAAANSATDWEPVPAIAFTSTRSDPAATTRDQLFAAAEIYLMNEDATNIRRVTENGDADGFPLLSPDGKKIVFDSNRRRGPGDSLNTSDVFVMNTDGTEQTWLARGTPGGWSHDSRNVVYHASASGTGKPIRGDPGSATEDSDIFVLTVDDVLAGVAAPKNITNDTAAIDDDPDWSPDGQKVVFTSHSVDDSAVNSLTAEIYVIDPDGSGRTRLTTNNEEERAPQWHPEGTHIVYMCRKGIPLPQTPMRPTFEICVMNADGTGQVRLTYDNVIGSLTRGGNLSPSWSPDGQKIIFHRPVPMQGTQLFRMNADGTGPREQLTVPPGLSRDADWSMLRQRIASGPPVQP